MAPKNLRDFKVDTGTAKDVKDTQQITGEAKKSTTWSEKNVTEQYQTSGGVNKSGAGGVNTEQ